MNAGVTGFAGLSAPATLAERGVTLGLGRSGSGAVRETESSFDALFARTSDKGATTPEAKARAAAEQIVSVALVQPILKQLRETTMAAPPFAPTQGEKQFQGLMDSAMAERIVHATRFPLVDRLSEQLVARSRTAMGAAAAQASPGVDA